MENDTNKIYKFIGISEYEKYYNEDSCYGAFNISTNENLPKSKEYFDGAIFDDEDENNKIYFINLAGKCQRLFVGCKYEIEATLEFNKRYNCWQYVPKTIKTIKPTTQEDNSKFLKSIITQKQSEELLKVYPNIIDMVINNEDIDLTNVKGIGDKIFEKIKNKILNSYGMSDLLIMLQPLGVTLKQIEKIKTLGENTDIIKNKITKNPYILTQIRGLGFKKVDGIAMKINPSIRQSLFRTVAFITYFFEDLGNTKGDTLCKLSTLRKEVGNIIPECLDIFDKFIKEDGKLLFIENDIVGLKQYINNEENILNLLQNIESNSKDYTNDVDFNNAMLRVEKKMGFTLTEEQQLSIKSTLNHGVTIITAKSGSGKTTSINGIIELYKDVDLKIALCSLSAKASRRMKEATGCESHTIHKLLGYGKSEDKTFAYDSENPLDYDVVILDEATMVNVSIFLSLLRAIKPTSKIVLVFDDAQLPPIGYGNVATDLLKSNFNICYLTKVHRQAMESGILTDANKLREQKFPIEKPLAKEIHGDKKDLCYMFRTDRKQMRDIMINHYLKLIDKSGIENNIIIVPRKKDCTNSTLEINKIIQDKLIPKGSAEEINRGDVVFRNGCRVIQRANNSDKDVINGELGYITNIYTKEQDGKNKCYYVVKFDDGKEVEFERNYIGDMELGYCLTAHSTQGSEWENAIVCVDNSHYSLLSNNLLYTVMTRPKKTCLIVAEPNAFKTCVTKKANKRHTYLNHYFKNKTK